MWMGVTEYINWWTSRHLYTIRSEPIVANVREPVWDAAPPWS
jgi:hypothetical protein